MSAGGGSGLTRRHLLGAGAGGAVALWGLKVRTAPGSALSSVAPTPVRGFWAELPSSSDDVDRLLGQVDAARGAVLRFVVDWADTQLEPQAWDWTACDLLRERLAGAGLKAVPVVVGCPEWIRDEERSSSDGGLAYPNGSQALNAYGDFVVDLLRRFALGGDVIAGVEAWSLANDPSSPSFISDPEAFGRIVATAALSVDSGCRSGWLPWPVPLIAGTLTVDEKVGSWISFVEAQKKSLSPHFPAFSLYDSSVSDVESVDDYGAAVGDVVERLYDLVGGVVQGDIWITATGARRDSAYGVEGQAAALIQILDRLQQRQTCAATLIGPIANLDRQTVLAPADAASNSAVLSGDDHKAMDAITASWSDPT